MNAIHSQLAKLSPAQRESLARRLERPPAQSSEGEIRRRTERGPAPLSFAQQGLWFLDQLQPGSAAYNMNRAYRLIGSLNVSALERTLNEIRRRHEVLRANFDSVDGQPLQTIAPFQPVTLDVEDLSKLPADQRASACQSRISRQVQHPFDLKSDPLMRVGLLRLGVEEHVLSLAIHHIASDGWSRRLLIEEIAALYEAFSQGRSSPLPDLPIQYGDYAHWQHEWLQGDVLDSHLSYWKKHLSGNLPVLELPADRARPRLQSFRAAHHSGTLSTALVQSLTALGQRRQASLFVTMLAAFQTLLHRYTGQEDIIVGTPIAGRTRMETEKLIGLFVNTLALRADLSANPTFEELLQRVRETTREALTYQGLPFEKLVEELHPERRLSHTPLFQVMLNAFLLPELELRLPALTIEALPDLADETKFDVTLYVRRKKRGLQLNLSFNADLFEPARMEEMLAQFTHLLEQVSDAPDKPIRSYSMVTERSRRLLPDPRAVLPEPYFAPVTCELLSWAGRTPQQTAVTQKNRSWTYDELSASAHGLARTLAAYGIHRGEVVAVTGPRSFGLVASVVAVLLSGGVLLTIDRDLPTNRQRLMLREARAKLLLYCGEWEQQDDWLREVPGLTILRLDPHDGRGTVAQSDAAPLPDIAPDDPAYVFFTSGTTGVPKGVLGCHKGLSHFLAWQRTTFRIGPTDRCAQLTNLSFDVVLRDIFLPLVSGATLCVPDESADAASDQILPWLEREQITLFHAVPTLAHTWLGTGRHGASLRALRWAFFAGEALTEALVRRWRDAFPESGEIVNLYGPTETTLVKCFQVVPEEPAPGVQPVGRPLPQTQALVLTENGQLCGVGEPGEISIRTPFRTLGYINAPEEQRGRFVPNPFRDDPRDVLYVTGDRGRYRADGSLEFLGRLDDQVKIRGVRIEPAEITAILGRYPGVKACIVVARKDSQGENILVAYVAPASQAVAVRDLRYFLAQQLPAAMVPSAFVFLAALPLMANGKVDRHALPEPEPATPESQISFVPARTPLEQSLADIWCQVLRLKQVGITDNFFDLGGHSLIATQLVSRIRRAFNVELAVRAIFERPTIESQALHLLEKQALGTASSEMNALLTQLESLTGESDGATDRGNNASSSSSSSSSNSPESSTRTTTRTGTIPTNSLER